MTRDDTEAVWEGFALFHFSLTGDAAGSVFLNIAPRSLVPEPTTVVGLAALGLAAVGVVRRRRAVA